jgi:hypothetical protein
LAQGPATPLRRAAGGTDGETVLMEQGNVDSVNHAEAVLARDAARRFTRRAAVGLHAGDHGRALRHVRRHAVLGAHRPLVYGMSEARLLQLTGNHAENPTLDLPCREVFARGQKAIEVIGPGGRGRGRDRRAAPRLLAGMTAARPLKAVWKAGAQRCMTTGWRALLAHYARDGEPPPRWTATKARCACCGACTPKARASATT